jgi:photosystem II stability/assembly factor-like uncharacterized protein
MLKELRHLAAGTERGVFLFRPRGPLTNWEMVGYGLYGQCITSLAVSGDGGIAAAVERGQVRYTRDWLNWKTLYRGLEHPDVHSVCRDPKSDRLYVGTCPAAVFRSEDNGHTWSSVGDTSQVSFRNGWTHPKPPHSPRIIKLIVHPQREDCLIGGVQSGGVIVSDNGGQTWRNDKAGLSHQLTDLRMHPERPERLYATNFLGFYRSDDLGRQWRQSNHGLPYQQAVALCAHSVEPDRLLLAVEHPEEEHSVLFRSDDGGNRWELACAELPTDEGLRVTCLESGGGVYFAGTQEGFLFGSRDRCQWEIVRAGLPPIRTLAWVGEFRAPLLKEDSDE